MAKWKPSRSPLRAPVTAPDFAGGRVLEFLHRYSLPLAIWMVLIAAARIASTYSALSVTADEPAHLACGMEYLANHTFQREPKHPPLPRAAAALLPYLNGAHPMGFHFLGDEGVAILDRSGDPIGTLAHARLGQLPFFLLACAMVYAGTRRFFGQAAAAVATAIFTLMPNVLALAGQATTDISLVGCMAAAFFAMTWWAERPSRRRAIIMGVAWGLAAVSKLTVLAFLPAAALLTLASYIWTERPNLLSMARPRAATAAIAAAVAALTVWAVYFFSFGPVPAWHISLPAPEFFQGIIDASRHNEAGHLAYLLGRTSQTGWWYYFPIAIAVKTPIAILLLLAVGAAVCWRDRARGAYVPLALSAGVVLVGMIGNVNIGIRHILPAYIGFAIVAAAGAIELIRRSKQSQWTLAATGALMIWLAISGAAAHPDYLAYFNEFASAHPEKVLVDSNLDWGQDLKLLSERLDAWNIRDLGSYGLNLANLNSTVLKWYALPPTSEPASPALPPGWYAVGQTIEKLHPSPAGFERLTPVTRIGGLLIYHVR